MNWTSGTRTTKKMVQDFEALMDNSSVYEEELQSLREKMNPSRAMN